MILVLNLTDKLTPIKIEFFMPNSLPDPIMLPAILAEFDTRTTRSISKGADIK